MNLKKGNKAYIINVEKNCQHFISDGLVVIILAKQFF